jgi:hypothetical protein
VISILNKERGETPRRMPDLDEPSSIITYKYVIIKLGKVPFLFLVAKGYGCEDVGWEFKSELDLLFLMLCEDNKLSWL